MNSVFKNLSLFGAVSFAVAGCMPPGGEFVVNTATGAVAGAVIANQGDDARSELVGDAVGTVTGVKPAAPESAAAIELNKQEAELRSLLAGTGMSVSKSSGRLVIGIPEAISFDADRALLKPEAMGSLKSISTNLLNHPNSIVQVIGHYDNSGSEVRRNYLANARADAVANALRQNGLSPLRLQMVNLSDRAPIASNESAAGRAQNRRVEIVIVPVSQ